MLFAILQTYQVFQNVSSMSYFAYIPVYVNDRILNLFIKDTSWKALQKILDKILTNLFWWFFSYSKRTTYLIVLLSIVLTKCRKYLEDFFILYISRLEKKIKPWIFFKRCAMESSTKSMQKTSMAKGKSLRNIFYYAEYDEK